MLFNNIETERLFLKNISIDDRDFIFSQFSNDVVNRYLFDEEPVTDMQGADEIITFFIQQPEPRVHRRWIILRKLMVLKWVHVDLMAGIRQIAQLKSGMI